MDYAFWEMICLKISIVALIAFVLLIRRRTDKAIEIILLKIIELFNENKEITLKLRSMEAKNDTINR